MSVVHPLTLVYVQAQNGHIADESFFKAWLGFRQRRIECELFEPHQLYQGALPLDQSTLVVGGVPVVEAALRTLGVPMLTADNLPESLAEYRGRRVWTSTWGELRRQHTMNELHGPLFVKPLRKTKAFPAFTLINQIGFLATAHLPDVMELLVSETVDFVTEWRCFVLQNQILDVCRYRGELFVYPDRHILQQAVADYASDAPIAYGIDFGILADGRTVLVEVNDCYSLGSYGLHALDYVQMLEARWTQLMASTSPP